MRFLVLIIVSCAAAWAVATSSDLFLHGAVRVYVLVETRGADEGDGLSKLPGSITEYRLSGNRIVSKNWHGIEEYEDCKIYDLENWSCRLNDGSGWFQMADGHYTASFLGARTYSAPQFEYYLYACRWAFKGGTVNGVIGCALAPFVQ